MIHLESKTVAMEPGIYDASGKLLATYEDSGMNVTKTYEPNSSQDLAKPAVVLKKKNRTAIIAALFFYCLNTFCGLANVTYHYVVLFEGGMQ